MTEFDRRFAELLGPETARALSEWAAVSGIGLRVNRVFVNGRSSATVLAVFEHPPGRSARKVIVKHDIVGDGPRAADGEHARQRRALADAGEFRQHLAGLVHEPIRTGPGAWISIQEVAGGLGEPELLTSLRGDALVGFATTVVTGILTRWAVRPELEARSMSDLLRRHLADRVDPGRALARLAERWPGRTIRLPGEAGELPNPFAYVYDPPPALNVTVDAVVGPGHGDLHTDNVLVGPDPADFWLIDLSRYTAGAPLTQDPVQLVLSIVNQCLGDLSPQQREALLELLAAPDAPDGPRRTGRWARLPGWLAAVVRSVRDAGLAWIAPSGLVDQWRQASVLSTVACALIYAARASTPDPNRDWLLRLAAHAAARFGATIEGGRE